MGRARNGGAKQPGIAGRDMGAASRVNDERSPCVLCSGEDAATYRRGMYRFDAVSYDLVRCESCGLVFVTPCPDGPTLARMYADPAYFTEGYNLGVETQSYFERGAELLEQYDGEVARLEHETGGFERLLELGAAGGFFLAAARGRGHSVQGVELSPVAARFAREELGLEIHGGMLEDAPYAPASFDLAVADNVLEHTLSPRATLRALRRLLVPGGHLLVVVPSYVNSPWFRGLTELGRLIPRRFLGPALLRILKLGPDPDAGPPYHLVEFDRRTLLRLLRETGFEIVAAEGSVPFPAEVFKGRLTPRTALLRAAFRVLDGSMRLRFLPPARLRVLARRR